MNAAGQQPAGRRYLQFSLRTLLLVMIVFGVVLGWKVNRARYQRRAVAWVQEMGGSVFYDFEVTEDGVGFRNQTPPVPGWLIDLV